MNNSLRLLIFVATTLLSMTAQAERADRTKPVNLEADRVSVDDKQQIQTFEGNVRLTQGTITISTSKLVVRQDAEGFHLGERRMRRPVQIERQGSAARSSRGRCRHIFFRNGV